MKLRLHQRIMTPNGPGLVQGRLVAEGKPDKILVSHKPKEVAPDVIPLGLYAGGIWVLIAYPEAQIGELHQVRTG